MNSLHISELILGILKFLSMTVTVILSDFGLARGNKTHMSTYAVGTYGYAAPHNVKAGNICSFIALRDVEAIILGVG